MLILVGENIEEGYFYYFDTNNKNPDMVHCIKPPYLDEPEPVDKLAAFRRRVLDNFIMSDNKPFDNMTALEVYAKERYNYIRRQMYQKPLSIYDDDFLKYIPKECAQTYIDRIKELIIEIKEIIEIKDIKKINEVKDKNNVCGIFLKQLSNCLSVKNDYKLKREWQRLQKEYNKITRSLQMILNKGGGTYGIIRKPDNVKYFHEGVFSN